MASVVVATTAKKRRGRKPRGGIASLNEIMTYQEISTTDHEIAVENTFASPSPSQYQTHQTQQQMQSIEIETAGLPTMSTDMNEFHHHNLDIPWQHNEATITPHEFQIKHQTQQHENIPDDELDDLDLFPDDGFVDYETIFKTQTSSSVNKGLHMSARDRENMEAYRPQTETHESTTFGTVPEHMRIISIHPASIPTNSSNETLTNLSTDVAEPEKETLPDFYHPFRLTFAGQNQTNRLTHRLEDAISWPSRSHFACWWCKHTFETYPKVVPISIMGEKIEVVGNFCTWNCGKAYSLKEFHRLDMFNTFYYKIFGHSANEIVPSPSYLCLDTFGGPLTIDQFRKCMNNPERSLNFELFAHLHIWVSKMFIRN